MTSPESQQCFPVPTDKKPTNKFVVVGSSFAALALLICSIGIVIVPGENVPPVVTPTSQSVSPSPQPSRSSSPSPAQSPQTSSTPSPNQPDSSQPDTASPSAPSPQNP